MTTDSLLGALLNSASFPFFAKNVALLVEARGLPYIGGMTMMDFVVFAVTYATAVVAVVEACLWALAGACYASFHVRMAVAQWPLWISKCINRKHGKIEALAFRVFKEGREG